MNKIETAGEANRTHTAIDCLRECPALGACCRRMVLWSRGLPFPDAEDATEAQAQIDAWGTGLPFEILERGESHRGLTGEPTGNKVWLVGCKMVMDDGTCGMYEHRPQLCRDFSAGTDELCIKHPECAFGKWRYSTPLVAE